MDRLCPVAQDGKALAPALTLAEVLRAFLPSVTEQLQLGARPRRVLGLLAACGTAQLGANLFVCDACHKRHFAPRSCGDRHCPRCLAAKTQHWLDRQLASLLPVTYYHCVFTLPRQLHALVQLNPVQLYPLLFDCASQSLLQFGRRRLGGDLGISAVLHTWGQQLNFHPHLHCIVTGGALAPDGQRFTTPKQRKFLFPIRALSALFRGKFLAALKPLLQGPHSLRLPKAWNVRSCPRHCFGQFYQQHWHVYAKRPFGGPEQLLTYLANYTHRVALSNRRLLALDRDAQTLSFTWRDYRHGSTVQTLCLSAREFIRRFSWHILPQGLVRIRHYGILANNRRQRDVARARQLLPPPSRRHRPQPAPPIALPHPLRRCPHCQSDRVCWIGFLDARGHLYLRAPPFCDSS